MTSRDMAGGLAVPPTMFTGAHVRFYGSLVWILVYQIRQITKIDKEAPHWPWMVYYDI